MRSYNQHLITSFLPARTQFNTRVWSKFDREASQRRTTCYTLSVEEIPSSVLAIPMRIRSSKSVKWPHAGSESRPWHRQTETEIVWEFIGMSRILVLKTSRSCRIQVWSWSVLCHCARWLKLTKRLTKGSKKEESDYARSSKCRRANINNAKPSRWPLRRIKSGILANTRGWVDWICVSIPKVIDTSHTY